MNGELTIFKTGGQVSTAFQGVHLPSQRLDDGISAGFAKVSYKGGKWGIKYQGQFHPVQARMADGSIMQSPFLDVVVLRSAGHPSKAWYEGVYSEGDNAPPDCWSTNGLKPDVGVPKQQCATCIGCQWNVWGSKVNRDTGEATRGKACMDSKRLAVVPVGDINNTYYGGPMMLNVPPTSLKRLGPYQNALEANGFHYSQVWTRITFEPQSAYPLFIFDGMSALNDAQAQQVIKMLNHPLIDRILNTELRTAEAWDDPTLNPDTPAPQVVTPSTSVPASSAPVTQSDQPDMTPPAHLQRPQQMPPSGPAPGVQQQAPAQPQQVAAQPEPPAAPTLPPGMVLPPGMTPEMAAAFMAQFGPTQGKGRGRSTKPRTPPVQPTNMDSSQTQPAGPAMITGPAQQTNGTGSGQPDQAVQSIMSTVKGLL